MSFSGDLCSSNELTEHSLLFHLEDRYKDALNESYVGSVLLRLSNSKHTVSQFLPSFSMTVMQSLVTSSQDQCVVINGYHTRGNAALSRDVLSAISLSIEDPSNLAFVIAASAELLDLMCCTAEDRHKNAVTITTLLVCSTHAPILEGATFSCALLDTSNLADLQVFSNESAIALVEASLQKIGMSGASIREVGQVLAAVAALLSGGNMAGVLQGLGVIGLDHMLQSDALAQLLYAYLVRWLVSWMNSMHRPQVLRDTCRISLMCSPGNSSYRKQAEKSAHHLASMMMAYVDEVFLNVYCTRLFVWEQEQYVDEGLEWEIVEVKYNHGLINSFQQDEGLLDILTMSSSLEEIKIGISKLCQFSDDSCFMVGGSLDTFALAHFTGEYEYVIQQDWLAMNNMHVASPAVQTLLKASSCAVLMEMANSMIASPDIMLGEENMHYCLLADRAKVVMVTLGDHITTSQPHFLFSLEPSKDDTAIFYPEFVLKQLQQFKILDAALIQSCGFPIRIKHSIFLQNYNSLFVDAKITEVSAREKCERILQAAHIKDYHVGLTMVMLKPWHVQQLDAALDLYYTSAKKLQHALRRSILKKKSHHSVPDLNKCGNGGPPLPPPRPSHTLSEMNLPYRVDTPPSQSHATPTQSHAAPNQSHTTPTQSYTTPTPSHATSIQSHTTPTPSHATPTPSHATPTPSHAPAHDLHRKGNSWKRKPSSNPIKEQSVTDVTNHLWFHTQIAREKSEECLKNMPSGCFMIRESQNHLGGYSLSLSHLGNIRHYRVDIKQGSPQQHRYQLYGAESSFANLEALVNFYSHHCISSRGEVLSIPYTAKKTQGSPLPLRRKLSTIRRPKPGVECQELKIKVASPRELNHLGKSLDQSDDTIAVLQRELEVEQRIVEGARRMTEIPSGNRRERQRRKQLLQQAQSKVLRLRQEFHTLKEQKLFIDHSMAHTLLEHPE